MKTYSFPTITPGQNISRDRLMALLKTAIDLGSNRFARELALLWLAQFPGDLPVNLLYANTLVNNRQYKHAKVILDKICRIDPEYVEAQTALASLMKNSSPTNWMPIEWNMYVLGKIHLPEDKIPEWVRNLYKCRLALSQDDPHTAENAILKTLLTGALSPLIALTHLQVCIKRNFSPDSLFALASAYHNKYPDTIGIDLILADAMAKCGNYEEALSLIHKAAASDVTGQVAKRLWGDNHPYKNLWLTRLETLMDIPIPIEIGQFLGLNKLPSGEYTLSNLNSDEAESEKTISSSNSPPNGSDLTSHDRQIDRNDLADDQTQINKPLNACEEIHSNEKRTHGERELSNSPITLSDTLRSIQETFEWVANRVKQVHIAKADGRFPVYVILTTRQGIQSSYQSSAAALEVEMKNLARVIKLSHQWDSLVFMPDDPQCMNPFGLKPIKPTDPWAIKLALADLDKVLSKRGKMIGAVLIIGGPEIVPFHRLPNPIDDSDEDVPSDNPYSTRDENYFIPEWPVGRLPGGFQQDANTLINALRDIAHYHQRYSRKYSWHQRYRERIRGWFQSKFWKIRPSWGYTAAIWRRASFSVFRPIGLPHTMLVSPPVQINGKNGKTLTNGLLPIAKLGYFNLHGLPDACEWYGQRDPTEHSNQPDYPIALRPQDIPNNGKAPQIVFSEACYGALIQNKKIEEAIALKFIASGTKAFIGSTCISYGSISPPLVSADLLGNIFWKFLKEGLTAGEALRRAKIQLAREMMQRQGYLDGEDQKTLISFVLFGDPLAQPTEYLQSHPKVYRTRLRATSIKTVCDRGNPPIFNDSPSTISDETLSQIKRWISQYLPGMSDANVHISQERLVCHGEDHCCPTSQFSSYHHDGSIKERKVITLSKKVIAFDGEKIKPEVSVNETVKTSPRPTHTHQHYVRITIDDKGKIIKMVMSR